MIADIRTIIWKEWKEIFFQYRKINISLAMRFIALGVASVLPVILAGGDWLTAPVVIILAIWIPLLTVTEIVGDTFAGERERNTLQTLLASRLSDLSILIGKVLSTGIYGWINVILMLIISLIATNILNWGDGFSFYSPLILMGSLLAGLLISLATALSGVIISLKSPTVKSAQQNLSSAFIMVVLSIFIIIRYLPINLWDIANDSSVWKLILFLSLGLIIIDTVLFLIAHKRFRREKLLLY